MLTWKRTLRTPHSERFLGLRDGTDAVAIDLHSMSDGTVASTVTLLASAKIEDDFLSGVNLTSGNLTFTLIRGAIVDKFRASAHNYKN